MCTGGLDGVTKAKTTIMMAISYEFRDESHALCFFGDNCYLLSWTFSIGTYDTLCMFCIFLSYLAPGNYCQCVNDFFCSLTLHFRGLQQTASSCGSQAPLSLEEFTTNGDAPTESKT